MKDQTYRRVKLEYPKLYEKVVAFASTLNIPGLNGLNQDMIKTRAEIEKFCMELIAIVSEESYL
jgi:hypothetical protein